MFFSFKWLAKGGPFFSIFLSHRTIPRFFCRSQIRQVNNVISGMITAEAVFCHCLIGHYSCQICLCLLINIFSIFFKFSILRCFIIWQLHAHTLEMPSTDTVLYQPLELRFTCLLQGHLDGWKTGGHLASPFPALSSLPAPRTRWQTVKNTHCYCTTKECLVLIFGR